MNYIKTGDYKCAREVLCEIFITNFSGQNTSIQIIKCRMFGLINIMLNAIGEINASYENKFIEDLDIATQLLKCKTTAELKNKMILILDSLEVYFKEKKEVRMTLLLTI